MCCQWKHGSNVVARPGLLGTLIHRTLDVVVVVEGNNKIDNARKPGNRRFTFVWILALKVLNF